jgi:spore coat polysaccharide biosynthesis protein SpsF
MVNDAFIILQARMSSSRLEGKVMKLIKGIPVIGILIERASQSDIPILLATSEKAENDILVDFVNSLGINVFRGSENNVLERFYLAAKDLHVRNIIRITGDNPLIDGKFIRDNYEVYKKINKDRVFLSTALSQTFPTGISIEIFSFNLLQEAFKSAKTPGEFEHVTPYMHQNMPGDIEIVSISSKINKYHYRLTVDTPEDFLFNSRLIEEFDCDQKSLDEIIEIIDTNQDLLRINRHVSQKSWDE